jgi:hypothetical protein
MGGDLERLGGGRFAVALRLPWGQRVPAELLVGTLRGWRERPEAADPRWAAYPIGPMVLALRLRPGLTQTGAQTAGDLASRADREPAAPAAPHVDRGERMTRSR